MPHGTPDWWGSAPKETTHALDDMGELAARLGSIVTYDRRGDVVFIEDFNGGMSAWDCGGEGVVSCDLMAKPTVSGSLAIRLTPPVGDGLECWARRVVPYPVLSKIGVEAWFTANTNLKYFSVQLWFYTAGSIIEFEARYNHTNGKIEIEDPEGTWNDIGTPGTAVVAVPVFNVIKMVVDILSGDYVRVIYNDHEYDASAKSGVVAGGVGIKMLSVKVLSENSGDVVLTTDVDNIIVTQNEPT